MLGLLFAQGVVAAHAGSVQLNAGNAPATVAGAAAPTATASSFAEANPGVAVVTMPCHGHAAGERAAYALAGAPTADANACEVHCIDLTPSASVPDLPPAVPSPGLRVDVVVIAPAASADVTLLEARSAAPPLRLAYVRFLI